MKILGNKNFTEYREQQEMAQVIGEIAQNTISLTLKPKLEEAEKQKAEAEAILANKETNSNQRIQAQIQLDNANQTIQTYGQGGDIQMAIRAVTGLLQGIATKNTGAAAVGLISPYANQFIKAQTGDNTTANLMAHALLGAIEAKATGTNALAGAAGALTGEAAAQLIAQKLYGIDGKSKTTNDLSESEKQTITALSQLAGGLAGGVIGDSTTSAVSSADIAKRAVENNHLAAVLSRGCLSVSLCRNQVIKEALIASGGLVTGGIIADNLLKNLSAEEVEHLMTLLMMGNNVITQKYIQSLTLKYDVLNPDDIPRLEGYPTPQPSEPIILVYPENSQDPSGNTLTTPIYNSDKEDSTLVGGEINVGDWRDSVLSRENIKLGDINPQTGNKVIGIKEVDSNIEVIIEGTKPSTKGKLVKNHYYENPGHHDPIGKNQSKYNSSKSVLPNNHTELWNNSIVVPSDPKNRWTVEHKNGDVIYHRFQNDGNGNYHWNGSTKGKTLSGNSRSIKLKDIPNELRGK